jgi:hypothetical protein
MRAMNGTSKPIIISTHAARRMQARGATMAEVEQAIRGGNWQPARQGKWKSSASFTFQNVSPVNGQFYNNKRVEVVFADEPTAIVVVTVKVFYFN